MTQPCTTSDVEIVAEDVCLSTLPWSVDRWPPAVPHNVVGRCPVSRLQRVTDDVEQDFDDDLERVDEELTRIERQLDSRCQQQQRRLRLPVVEDRQVSYRTMES